MEDPNQSEVLEELRGLLSQHGLDCTMEPEWLVPNGRLPAIRAKWYPREKSGRLDVEVLLEKGRVIQECFVGIGTGRAGLENAMINFSLNSLHVLLSSLWNIKDDQQVLSEDWEMGGRPFTAYIGNFGRRASGGMRVEVPKDLFETIRNRICQEGLPGDIHWFRVFFCNVAGQHTYEALKDNALWEAGLAGLKGIVWPETDGYYSVRNFIVLRRA
jgi:Family of unknown function (DUF6348)